MQSSHVRGFTLIELLVVLSIITLLVAILLPALQKARETANAVKCLSQQRQCGLAMLLYVNDFEGVFPTYFDFAETRYWSETLSKGLDYIPVGDVFFCPSASPPFDSYEGTDALSTAPLFHVYGMPIYADDPQAVSDFMTGSTLDSYMVLARMDKPSNTFILTDSVHPTTPLLYPRFYVRSGTSNASVHLRHDNRAAAWMADGSARFENEAYFHETLPGVMVLTEDGQLN